jgi:response regulator RpfG family c-di-GMP phosphodiesterase
MNKPAILFVDDQSFMFELIRGTVTSLASSCRHVRTLKLAIEHFQASKFGLIICDISLQEESGLDFVKFIRDYPGAGGIPIIMLSQYDEKSSIDEAMECGADDYIIKPFQLKRLRDAIIRWTTLGEYDIAWDRLPADKAQLTRLTMATMGSAFFSARQKQDIPFGMVRDNCLSLLKAGTDSEITGLLAQIKGHDVKTYLHSVKFAAYLGMMASGADSDKDTFLDIVTAGLLHDIGITRVPRDLLEKDRLTEREKSQIDKLHVMSVKEIIASSKQNLPEVFYTVATQHHERLDGSGPLGKIAEELGALSRMAAVIEEYLSERDAIHGGTGDSDVLTSMMNDQRFDQAYVQLMADIVTSGAGPAS